MTTRATVKRKEEGRMTTRVTLCLRKYLSIFYRQILAARPAGTNENPQLELSGIEHPE
jgi:hypothetical protein